jgi:hypothetical protein
MSGTTESIHIRFALWYSMRRALPYCYPVDIPAQGLAAHQHKQITTVNSAMPECRFML